ncbi:MAG TPA: arginine deiminase-related protein [Gemmatimonadota bacterium]|nr:arginine deiminase-related protein [Gemmatimonadota bacterium]
MSARRVLMIEPIGFRSNPETIGDNAFQRPPGDESPQAIEIAAREEFARLRDALESRGVEVEWRPAHGNREAPDAVFPNNWFSTHAGGTLVLYPMRSPSRRLERRAEIVDALRERYPELIDLTAHEAEDRFLEGTGSLVIDERSRIVYASESPRTDRRLVEEWAERFELDPVIFRATDAEGRPIYHTNVVMSLGSEWAVVCAEAIDPLDRPEVLATLAETGHETMDISLQQMEAFCGNVLELENDGGEKLVVMSDRAFYAFTDEQRAALGARAELVHADLTTIETHGGGSARCMLAELH